MIKSWKPWEKSTGPKTQEGKEVCKMNAEKHGMRGFKWQFLRQALKEQEESLEKTARNITLEY